MADEVIIQGTTSANSTLADGTLRIKIDIPPQDADEAYKFFGKPGELVALAPLKQTPEDMRRQVIKENNGHAYEVLYREGFFSKEAVAAAMGDYLNFREWIEDQRCILHGQGCHGDVVAAHVRRVSRGSGTGTKPDYSCVPMCDKHHREQHDQGYSAVGGIEKLEKQADRYLARWVVSLFELDFEVESLREVQPQSFYDLCEGFDIHKYLPGEFMEYV